MTKREDEEKAVGGAVMDAVKKEVRAAVGSSNNLTGAAKALSDLVEEIAGQQQALTLHIFRQGTGLRQGIEEYITPLYNVNADMLKEGGIEPLIQQYCGGGVYRISVRGEGIKTRNIQPVFIAGEPLPPKPERDMKNMMAAGGMLPPGFMNPVMGPAGMGYNAGAPGAAQYLGVPGASTPSGKDNHVADTMMLMNMMWQMQQQHRASGTESDEMKVLREQLAEMKTSLASKEQEKLRTEADARHAAELATLRSEMKEALASRAEPKEDSLAKIATAVLPVVTEMLKSREAAANTQMQIMTAVLGSQKDSSNQSLEMFKTILSKPTESETERMQKVMEIATGAVSTSMGLTQAMVNQMAALQGGERTWWQDAILNGIEKIGEIGQTVLASRAERSDRQLPPGRQESDDEEEAIRLAGGAAVRELPGAAAAAAVSQEMGIADAAAAAAGAAQQQLASPPIAEEVSPEVPTTQLPDLSAGAFQLVFEKIQNDGDPNEIAFRIWKHASSGDKEALAWVRNPEQYTIVLLDALAQKGDIIITAERINQIADAMVNLYMHFVRGSTAKEFIEKYNINISEPKRIVVAPLEVDPDAVEEGADAAIALTSVEEPVEETPAEPVVPTPTYGVTPPTMKV